MIRYALAAVSDICGMIARMLNVNELDSQLLAHIDHRWRKVHFVVGAAMIAWSRASGTPDDRQLIDRIIELVGIGALESRGDLESPEYCEVRLVNSTDSEA